MKIVFVSHSFYSPYFVVGSHQLARQMARRGHEVWHISAIPLFHLLNPKRRDYRVRVARFFHGTIEREKNLHEAVIRPLLPWQLTRRLQKSGNYFLKFSDIRLLASHHPELKEVDALIVDEPRLIGIENCIHAKSIYYRPTDLYAESKKDESIRIAEASLLAHCRGLIATSELVLNSMLNLRPNIPNLLLTNGVDPDDFSSVEAEPAAFRGISRPRVIYVGAIDGRLDRTAIQFLADRFPTVQFLVVGDGACFKDMRAMQGGNIHVLGLIPHAALNAYLQHCEIGMLPMSKSRSNEGRSPMKIYEYGIAGLPVIASRTPELERRNEPFVHLYSDYNEAAQALSNILDAPGDRAATIQQSATQSWSQKACALENFIETTQQKPEPLVAAGKADHTGSPA